MSGRFGGEKGLGRVYGDSWELSLQYSVALAGEVGLRGSGLEEGKIARRGGGGGGGAGDGEILLRSSHRNRVAEWADERERSMAGPPPPTAASTEKRRQGRGKGAGSMRSELDTLQQNVSLSKSAGECGEGLRAAAA